MQPILSILFSGGHFKTLFDWRFDKIRSLKDRNFRKNKNHEKIIDRDLFEYELFDDKSEILDIVLLPVVPKESHKIYNLLTKHIVLVSNGFGVGFRETRYGLSEIFKTYGVEYRMIKPFVDDLEYRLMIQHSEDTAKK